MTLPTITPPPLGTSSSAAPASKGYDFSQRSGSSIGSSNPDGSNPALTTTPPPASLPVSSDTNSATTSYPSASPYGSPSSGTSAATSTYRQSRYGYGLPTDSTAGPPQAALGNSTVPDAGAMAGSAMAAGPMPSSGRRDDGTYKVRPNDNYWTISEKLYGTGAYFRALAEVNRDRTSRDDHLRVGAVLQAPPAEELEKNYADLCPKANHRRGSGGVRTMSVSTVQGIGRRVYVVEQGDTLMDVARRQLGKASRWAEIYELNRDKLGEDHDYLVPGMQLAMPEPSTPPAGRNDSLTERPGSYYRR
jgi:nucleoid-associated protein YgaU